MVGPLLKNNKISNEFVEKYTKSTYRIVGPNKHSSIKPCHWLEQRLMTGRDNRNCYKGVFGIESHRCLQNTPSLPFCNHQCVFCWRDLEVGSLSSEFVVKPDEPSLIIDEMIRHQKDIIKNHLPLRRYLDNYEIMIDILYFMIKEKKAITLNKLATNLFVSKNKIERALNLLKNQHFLIQKKPSLKFFELDPEIECCIETRDDLELLINRELTTPDDIMNAHAEAMFPNHAAISLDGEPFLYPRLSEYINEFRKRDMTSFVVTNGTLSNEILNLETNPSQLYVTIPAPNKKIYKRTCRPMIRKGWEHIMNTLESLNSVSCRTLVRLTAVKNLNVNEKLIKEYVNLIEKTNPNFFEIKGFTLQAKALLISKRLKSEKTIQNFFPDFEYLNQLAEKFEEHSGFSLVYKNRASRDFLFTVNWDESKDIKIK